MRLLAVLAQRFLRRVTVVTAPAGFGKTMLLTQAQHENRLSPKGIDCSVCCGPDDRLASHLGERLLRELGAEAAPTGKRNALEQIVESVLGHSPFAVALLIDDLQELGEDSGGSSLVRALVEKLPANGHLVLATRVVPSWLSEMAVPGMVRIGEEAMRFTVDEVAEYAVNHDIDLLVLERTGGWPALMALASSARHSGAAEMIWNDVLGAIDPDRRRLLASFALLGAVDRELANSVAGTWVDIDAVVRDLPLVEWDGTRVQLHSLWSTALRGVLPEADRMTCFERAARTALDRGELERAARWFRDAGYWDGMAQVIRVACEGQLAPLAPDVLREWWARIPPRHRDEPNALLLSGVVAMTENTTGAQDRLQKAAALYRKDMDVAGELLALSQLILVARWHGDVASLGAIATRLMELDSEGIPEAAPFAALVPPFVHALSGNGNATLTALEAPALVDLPPTLAAIPDWLRAGAFIALGRPEEALQATARAITRARPGALTAISLDQTSALLLLGRIGEAHSAANTLVETAEQTGMVDQMSLARAVLALVEARRGRHDRAQAELAHAKRINPPTGNSVKDTVIALTDATIALDDGDVDGACAIAGKEIESRPLGQPGLVIVHRFFLPLLYVLRPETRSYFDAEDLGPAWATGLRLARLVVRSELAQTDGKIGAESMPDPSVVQCWLPASWMALVGVARMAGGDPDGAALVEACGPTAPRFLRPLAATPGPVARAARRLLAEVPALPSAKVELLVLGRGVLRRGGVEVVDGRWRRKRVRNLLYYLVAHPGCSRERIASDLWPELSSRAADRNLRVNLSHLLAVLEPGRAEGEAPFFIRSDGDRLSFVGDDWLWVDAHEFERHVTSGRGADTNGTHSLALKSFLAAIDLWRGDFLEDVLYDDWASAPRERIRTQFLQASFRSAELLMAGGSPEKALALADRALVVDPYAEAGYRISAAIHLSLGDRDTARRKINQCRAVLSDLGARPDPLTTQIDELIASGGNSYPSGGGVPLSDRDT
jgi:DNA-binding SARP family transcriptional activator